MTVYLSHTTVDCHNAYELSEWWRVVLDYIDDAADPNEPGHEECMIYSPENGHTILFIEVPDDPLPAKRIHFDVRPTSRTQDAEVEWLYQQGAQLVADHRGIYGPDTGWVTLADPEGNHFCVLRSRAEIEDAGAFA